MKMSRGPFPHFPQEGKRRQAVSGVSPETYVARHTAQHRPDASVSLFCPCWLCLLGHLANIIPFHSVDPLPLLWGLRGAEEIL